MKIETKKQEKQLLETIVINAEKASRLETTADEALKYTQAALNAAHVLDLLNSIKS